MLWTPVRTPPIRAPRRRGRLVDACIFCGAPPPLTDEHVWSQWLAIDVPELGGFGTEITGIVGAPESLRRQRRKASSLKPKVVCAACNNGWMSRLQQSAKPYLLPMIRGEECTLDAPGQEIVAAWLTMTAMTACWVNRDVGGWAIPQEHRTAIYETEKAPLTTQVWVAPCAHDDRPPRTHPYGLRYRIIRLDHLYGSTITGISIPARPGYGAALSAGNLAALVFGHTYAPPVHPQLRLTGLLQLACKQIWPAQSKIVEFPRDSALDYNGFNQLITVLEPWQ
jgi:hypothetical protein